MKSQTVTQAVLDFLEEAAYLARQSAVADALTAAERKSIGDRLAEIAAVMGIGEPSRSRG
jgi:hypothetical protein